MTIPRVIFLSAPPLGDAMLVWLKHQPCDVVLAHVNDEGLFPGWGWAEICEYDLGLNFLGTHRIPADQCHKFANFHPAPLPEYGGRNVAYHAIMDGAKEYGATVHYMTENFDDGPIIECRRFSIANCDTAGDIFYTSTLYLIDLFKKWAPELLKGRVPAVPQDGKTRYFKKEPIDEVVPLMRGCGNWGCEHHVNQERLIRALTFAQRDRFAKVVIGGKRYNIVPE